MLKKGLNFLQWLTIGIAVLFFLFVIMFLSWQIHNDWGYRAISDCDQIKNSECLSDCDDGYSEHPTGICLTDGKLRENTVCCIPDSYSGSY
jgi:hypothetical protein